MRSNFTFFYAFELEISIVQYTIKDRPLKFSLTFVCSDRELKNKFASLPGDEKKEPDRRRAGILATFDPIFSEKPNTKRERERKQKRTFKYRRRAE